MFVCDILVTLVAIIRHKFLSYVGKNFFIIQNMKEVMYMIMDKSLINIGICDDDIGLCSKIENDILDYCKSIKQMVNIEIYYTGKTLYEVLKKEVIFDLLFLDIELGKDCSGVDIGHYIRYDLLNESMQIIYISSYEKYALELFQNRPMDFLIKPITSSKIAKSVRVGIKLIAKNTIPFQFKQGRDWNKVYIDSILYFKSKDREVEMVTCNERITFYSSLESIYEKLRFHRFFYAHKSYLVNYLHVSEFYYDRLLMSNQEVIQIAQTRRKTVREIQKKFLIREIEDASK